MRKSITYILLFTQCWGALTNDRDFSELGKIPHLFFHFAESRDANSFLEFLITHYTDYDAHAPDNEHRKLPFHDHAENATILYSISFHSLKWNVSGFYPNLNSRGAKVLVALDNFKKVIKPPQSRLI